MAAAEHTWIRETPQGVVLTVRAQPGARRTAIAGIYGDGNAAQLKIAVQAPPIEGRANEALIAYLAKLFAIPKSAVVLISGDLSRSKGFLLSGITRQRAESVLAELGL